MGCSERWRKAADTCFASNVSGIWKHTLIAMETLKKEEDRISVMPIIPRAINASLLRSFDIINNEVNRTAIFFIFHQ